ncbi:MAG: YitT family protein [Treponema sp.]|nr:YitT family protein [Treponema sp.]
MDSAGQPSGSTPKRLCLILLSSGLMAFNVNTFIHAGALVPGGFTGLTLLIQETALRFGNVRIPFSIILYALNAAPALICLKYIGKRFALYSCLQIIVSGFLTDWMPPMFIEIIQLHDILLSAVFGGLLNAVSIALCLYAGASSGGTDFIAIFISEKYRKDAWNYIFAGNCMVLAAAACLFALDRALYSIIFQFTATMALSFLYRGYQQRTMLIVTVKPDEVYALIRDMTHHAATSLMGRGFFQRKKRALLYSVVSADEVNPLIAKIKQIDPGAFINVLKTEQINGRFYMRPRD